MIVSVMASHDALISGSNGYTGQLIVERALERALRPELAGRNVNAVRQQAAVHPGLSFDPASRC